MGVSQFGSPSCTWHGSEPASFPTTPPHITTQPNPKAHQPRSKTTISKASPIHRHKKHTNHPPPTINYQLSIINPKTKTHHQATIVSLSHSQILVVMHRAIVAVAQIGNNRRRNTKLAA